MSQEFLGILEGKLRFDSAQMSFCTHFSWFGVTKNDRLGVEQLHLFYNRAPRLLSPNFLTLRVKSTDGARERQMERRDHPLFIEESDGHGFTGRAAFLDNDILCYSFSLDSSTDATEVSATLLLPETEPRFTRKMTYDPGSGRLRVETRLPRTDHRDPDADHPITICIAVPPAFGLSSIIADAVRTDSPKSPFAVETDGTLVVTFSASGESVGSREQVFVTGIGEGPSADRIQERMPRVRTPAFDSALDSSRKWLADALDRFSLDPIPKRRRSQYAMSVYQILSNTKSPRGQIGRRAVFPSRGTYCCHYLWDTCFTNLGVARFNERLAEDFVVALCECQEPDGKIPHFVCATWNDWSLLEAWNLQRLQWLLFLIMVLRQLYFPMVVSIEDGCSLQKGRTYF